MSEVLNRYRNQIIQQLQEAVPNGEPLASLVGYPLGLADSQGGRGPGIGGKLLRPSLTCLSCEALGGQLEGALPLTAALELVHVFSLVHDDIQDGDELRRGRPTTWRVFGTSQAINSGDALLVLAFRTALDAPLGEKTLTDALRALVVATQRMIEGQVLDLRLQKRGGDTEAYLGMARLKTGALLGCALELGAWAAKRGDLAPAHRHAGEELGLAFQIQDDMLGLWGDPKRTGKPVGSDLAERKRSYPLALALEEAPDLEQLLQQDPVPLERILQRMEELNVPARCQSQARRRLEATTAALEPLPWNQRQRRAFEELIGALAAREA